MFDYTETHTVSPLLLVNVTVQASLPSIDTVLIPGREARREIKVQFLMQNHAVEKNPLQQCSV